MRMETLKREPRSKSQGFRWQFCCHSFSIIANKKNLSAENSTQQKNSLSSTLVDGLWSVIDRNNHSQGQENRTGFQGKSLHWALCLALEHLKALAGFKPCRRREQHLRGCLVVLHKPTRKKPSQNQCCIEFL